MADTERWGQGTNHLYRELLFIQEGRCFVCLVEEWRQKRPLQMHRIIKHGEYSKKNVVLVCTKCHRKSEGLTREQLIEARRSLARA